MSFAQAYRSRHVQASVSQAMLAISSAKAFAPGPLNLENFRFSTDHGVWFRCCGHAHQEDSKCARSSHRKTANRVANAACSAERIRRACD